MKTCPTVMIALLWALALARPAAAEIIISTYDHNGDGVASGAGADTYIDDAAPTRNYGANSSMCLRNQPQLDGSNNRYQQVAYARFDLSAIDRARVADARLQVYDFRFDGGGRMRGNEYWVWALEDQSPDSLDAWQETALTWANAPGRTDDGIASDDPDFDANAICLGSFRFAQETSDTGWSVPIGGLGLLDVICSDTDHRLTLMITGAQGPFTLFHLATKEAAFDRLDTLTRQPVPVGSLAPRLLITTVPEPATAWLALVGLGLGTCRLRHSALKAKPDRS